jgi:hypothetical protein
MPAAQPSESRRVDLTHDFLLPTLLFAALGAMSWAVRGTAGASAMNAHIAPGLLWGAAWWFVARQPSGHQSRRYASGWVIFALTVGFALAGNRGWVQWANFFDGRLLTNSMRNEWVPISRTYGFLWLFIAGATWAALPACLLAWCAQGRALRAWEWTLRLGCGFGGAYFAWHLFARFPEIFLPKFDEIASRYHDFPSNPNLARLDRDNGAAIRHAGYCLGFLSFEAVRKDWKNVALISTVGLLNGVGWAICQNWKWATHAWPDAHFNFWRCWECCGGISIGAALGVAYLLVNRTRFNSTGSRDAPVDAAWPRRAWLLAAGLLLLLGWTEFWPAARDLRLGIAERTPTPDSLLGAIRIAAGLTFVIAALGHRLLIGNGLGEPRHRPIVYETLEFWSGIGLTVVFAAVIREELIAGFGDGVRNSQAALLDPGNVYFCIVLVSCCLLALNRLQTPRPTLDTANSNINWLTTYLSLAVILLAGIGVNMETWWHAPLWFGVVGAAFGIAYWLFGTSDANTTDGDPNLERWGACVGLLYGLGLSLRKALKGGAESYLGNERYWDSVCWNWVALAMLVCLSIGAVWLLRRRLPASDPRDRFPHAAAIIWLVLIAENVVAQVVTGPVFGPRAAWNDFMFNLLYLMLFAVTAVIVYQVQLANRRQSPLHIDTFRRNREQ